MDSSVKAAKYPAVMEWWEDGCNRVSVLLAATTLGLARRRTSPCREVSEGTINGQPSPWSRCLAAAGEPTSAAAS